MRSYKLTFLCLGFLCLQSSYAQSGGTLFDDSYLHEIRLNFAQPAYWDTLTTNYQNWVDNQHGEDVYTAANITIDGYELPDVGVRFKGLASYYYVDGLKKPMKVDLNEFVADQHYLGIEKFNLHNGACDPTMMRDFVAYDVLRKAGVKAPRMAHCRLYINDEFFGVYGVIEQIDKNFLKDNFADDDGNLFKNNGWSELQWFGADPSAYQEDFQLKTNKETNDWSDFIHFLDVLNHATDEDFATEIEKVFDVNAYLHVLATDIMLNNWDSYIQNERNWYLYHEPSSGKMHWIPWDYNLSLGGDVHSVGNPFPPVDPICNLMTDFSVSRDGNTATFSPRSNQNTVYHLWEFGDGTASNEAHPSHTYPDNGTYTVCYTGGLLSADNSLCQQRRCQKIDMSFDANSCYTIISGESPYSASDPIYQQVVAQDEYCCSDSWDAVCNLQYFAIYLEQDTIFGTGVEYNKDLPLVPNDASKILIDRILSVPAFRQKYFNIACTILENNFNAERLFPLIDSQTELIRSAIYEDPNYIFTWDYFEYDAGDGSGGGQDAEIPALKWVLAQRFDEIADDLQVWNEGCEDAFTMLGWQALVINEVMASNDENSGITDPEGESEDWIEIYNNTNETLDLTHFYLSDDENDFFKWNFPIGTTIQPDDYLIVWADKDEAQSGIHSNFKLKKSGESLFLTHQDGTVLDSISFGEQTTNIAIARIPNGIGDFVAQLPTFNMNNEPPNATTQKEVAPVFKVFPNPATQYLIVETQTENYPTATFQMFNATGSQVLLPVESSDTKHRLNISDLSAGVYFLEIQHHQHLERHKIIVK